MPSSSSIQARLTRMGIRRRDIPMPALPDRKEKDSEITKLSPGRVKTAEPPPPKGVSVQEWDKILQGKKKEAGTPIARRWARMLKRRPDLQEEFGHLAEKTAAQDPDKNKDGYKLQGRENFQGLPIAIENAKGSVRKGKNDDGSEWETKFKTPYGYIEGTKGADGDEIDAYVGPDKKAPKAFVVHQKKSDGSHDEDTVMLGFRSAAAAKKDILRHYDDKSQVGSVSAISMEALRRRVMPGKKIVKIGASSSATGSDQAAINYREGDPSHATGIPARRRRKKGELPSREDMNTYPKAENRQDSMSTQLAGSFSGAESTSDIGKAASATDKAKGIKRVGQLLTGSRYKAFMSRASEHTDRARKHIADVKAEILPVGPISSGNVVSLRKYKRAKSGPDVPGVESLGRSAGRELRASEKILGIARKEGKRVSRTQGAVAGTAAASTALVSMLVSDRKEKKAEALGKDRALGDQRKKWEGPTRDDVGRAPPETHKGRGGYVQLSDISTSVGQDESKTSSALGDSLAKLSGRGLPRRKQPDHGHDVFGAGRGDSISSIPSGAAPTDGLTKSAYAMVDELEKLGVSTEDQIKKLKSRIEEARAVDRPEAVRALKRLKRLQKDKPSVGQIARGALVGSAVGPAAMLASRAITGASTARPGKLFPGKRAILAAAGHGAVFGGLLPAGRHKLERAAEKQKLREYVGQHRGGSMRSKIKKHLGV